jgi:hypothetical protein
MASSTHEDYKREHAIKGSSDRGFGQVFAGFFAILGFWPLLHGEAPNWWLVGIGAAFLIVAYTHPSLLAVPNRWWMKFGLLLAKIVNPLVMGLVFYLTVTPTGWIMRALGKDPLRLRIDRQATSYWIERKPPGPAPETMSQQF